MRTDSRELLAVGVFGNRAKIGDRIEILLRCGRASSSRASTRDIIVSAIALSGLILAGSFVPRWIAFAQDARPRFDVASVKPSPAPNGKPILVGMVSDPGRFKGSFVTVPDLIARAYGIDHSRISGGPPWAFSDHYEVIATLPRGTAADRIRLMLQTLLAERFRLIVRRDTRMTRVYALVPAQGGPRLKPSEGEDSPSPGGTPARTLSSVPITMRPNGAFGICCGKARLNRVSMGRFAALLSAETDRPVQDATGIEGEFDISLEWTPDSAAPQPGRDTVQTPSPTGPSIYTAVQEQLGLRLEPHNMPLEYLVIEHAEKPDAN